MAPGGKPVPWRDQVRSLALVNVIAGVWLILSPWILGYTGADPSWNPIVSGVIVLMAAVARFASPAHSAARGVVNAVVGAWLFISGFWLSDSTQATWNVWIGGIVVFCAAVIGISTEADAQASRE